MIIPKSSAWILAMHYSGVFGRFSISGLIGANLLSKNGESAGSVRHLDVQ